jgi:hypothetical protein
MRKLISTFKASNISQSPDKTLSKPECTAAHKTQWAQTGNTQRSQQHKTNMSNHRSLQRTLLQVEIQKNSKKQLFTYSDSKKNSKGIPKARRSANIGKRVSNIRESTRRFNVASPKNAQRTLSHCDPNEPQPRRAIRKSTDHMI